MKAQWNLLILFSKITHHRGYFGEIQKHSKYWRVSPNFRYLRKPALKFYCPELQSDSAVTTERNKSMWILAELVLPSHDASPLFNRKFPPSLLVSFLCKVQYLILQKFVQAKKNKSRTVESTNHPNTTPRFGQILHACAQPASPE